MGEPLTIALLITVISGIVGILATVNGLRKSAVDRGIQEGRNAAALERVEEQIVEMKENLVTVHQFDVFKTETLAAFDKLTSELHRLGKGE